MRPEALVCTVRLSAAGRPGCQEGQARGAAAMESRRNTALGLWRPRRLPKPEVGQLAIHR